MATRAGLALKWRQEKEKAKGFVCEAIFLYYKTKGSARQKQVIFP
jgi:hypothetical protein